MKFDFRRVQGGIPSGTGSLLPLHFSGKQAKSQANQSPLVPLLKYGSGGMRGISYRSWNWTLKSIGKSDGTERAGATESTFTRTTANGETTGTWTGVNKLPWMRKIMKRSIAASVHAAAEMMKNLCERKVKEATK